MHVSDENLHGRTVIAGDGQVIGEITAVLFDTEGWQVDALQIKLRKETADQLGAHRSVFRAGELEIPIRMVQSVGETVILAVAVVELQKVLPSENPDATANA